MAPLFIVNYEIFGLYLIRGKDQGKVNICILKEMFSYI